MKNLRKSLLLLLLGMVFGMCSTLGALAQGEELAVLAGWTQWSDAANLLQHRLNDTAFELLQKRLNLTAGLKTAKDWQERISAIQATLNAIVGPFPVRTPLNARILGTVRKDGYTVEKIVFESMPGLYVTNCLFIPSTRTGKSPAILFLSGHTAEAFRHPRYQQPVLNLVAKGFIVLAMDPVGQGERQQYYDPGAKKSLVGGATTEHSYFGTQCFLTGTSAARYFTWDGMRAIDYLVSRPEVDPDRIGVTGLSGGGTQTGYVASMDPRVAAAAPSCFITSFRRLLESIGPQDAEQNFNRGLFNAIDHADLLEVRAPRPTLVVATTRDFFSIQGARETFSEVKTAYRALGAGEKLEMVEDDFEHGYTKKTREAIYAFFQRTLNNPGSPTEIEIPPLPPEDITVTRTGQVGDSLGGESVFSINRAEAERLIARLEESRQHLPEHLSHVKDEAGRVSGFRPPADLSEAVFRGRYARSGYHVEMYALKGEGQSVLPLLLMLPDSGAKRTPVLCLHPKGKAAAAAAGGEIEQMVKRGYAVLAPDLSGIGELGRATDTVAFLGVQTGRTVVGMRAEEIVRCFRFLRDHLNVAADEICVLAFGELGIPLLHAAAEDDSLVKTALVGPLLSFQSVVTSRFYSLDPGSLIGNVLTAYDLTDLAASLAPRRLLMLNPVDAQGRPATDDLVTKSTDVVRRAYNGLGATGKLRIETGVAGNAIANVIIPWLD